MSESTETACLIFAQKEKNSSDSEESGKGKGVETSQDEFSKKTSSSIQIINFRN